MGLESASRRSKHCRRRSIAWKRNSRPGIESRQPSLGALPPAGRAAVAHPGSGLSASWYPSEMVAFAMDDKTSSPSPESKTDHTVTSGIRARGAVKIGTMRYVLGISLALAIVAIAIAYVLIRR